MARSPGSPALALPGVILVMVTGALDQTITGPALPAIADDLGGLHRVPAVVTGYLLAATVVMPLYGKLGDRFGRKPVLLAAIGVFVAGAVLCASATSMPQLVAFRIVQGMGGGGLVVGAQATIGELVSPRERGRYLGMIGAGYLVAVVAGPLLGGVLVDRLGWRWIFAIFPPLGALAFALLARTLHLPTPSTRPPLDYAGALALATAVVGVVLLGQTASPIWIVVAAVGAAAWLATARRAIDPVLPLRLLRDRAVAIPVAISFLVGFALIGTVAYLPMFLQMVLGATATGSGLPVASLMVGVLLTTVVSGQLITRSGRYKPYPVVGTALAAIGLAALALVGTGHGAVAIGAAALLVGLGIGLVMQVMVLATQNAVDYRDLGTATSSVAFLRQMGASVGTAVIGALITWRLAGQTPTAAASAALMPSVFGLMAPVLALAFVLALALPARPLRTTAHAYVEERS